jgi:hypothetical protein
VAGFYACPTFTAPALVNVTSSSTSALSCGACPSYTTWNQTLTTCTINLGYNVTYNATNNTVYCASTIMLNGLCIPCPTGSSFVAGIVAATGNTVVVSYGLN